MRRGLAPLVAAFGLYGTMVGLGILPLPAAAIALVAGQLSGNLNLALWLALSLSLIANLALAAYTLRSQPWRWRRRPRRTRPKAYSTPGELDTILLTSADFESWWANLLRVARERVGPDAEAYVETIHLDPAFIVFRGQSVAAGKAFSGTVGGTDPADVDWYGVHRTDRLWTTSPEPPLWRTDDSWRELLQKAWLRERPRRSLCTLKARGRAGERYWELDFGPYSTDDERLIQGRSYTLRDGQLQYPST